MDGLTDNYTPKTNIIMGDKSPKSKQKDKNQKQSKTNSSQAKRQNAIDSKRQGNLPGAKKK
ncbi:MAG: hypothetical protein ACI8UO_001116 [Verrucomicrobiales bacterium]